MKGTENKFEKFDKILAEMEHRTVEKLEEEKW
jgi:hypothetical protein